ncbi:hypothetical protein Tco_0618628 [Tanacetum coccineum]
MSSATSAVTYTSVYTDSEPGRAFWGADDEEVSEGGIPRVIILGYDGLPLQPVAPPSPDYIPGPENPQTPPVPQDEDEREPMFVQAHDPDYVPEPIYPEYIPLEDDHEFPAEEQPLPPVDSPTAESPGYVTESDPEEDPEEYEDDETEDGPVDYPMDGGDDGDDDDGDSSKDDANDEDEDEEDEEDEEEEEHLAPADSTTVIPADEPVFPPEGTEPVIPPPSTDITIGARITVRPQTSISLPPEAEVERLLTMTTPSPSPPISLSPPSAGERLVRCTAPPTLSSPPPVPLPLLPSSGCPTQIQTLRMASTQALVDAVTAALPLPPSLYKPPPVDCMRSGRVLLSTARPTRGRGIDYGFVSTVDAEERRHGIRDVGYGIRDTWVDTWQSVQTAVSEIAPMTVREVNTRVIELAELHEWDTKDLYALLEDAQDSRSRISQKVNMDSQRVDLLMGDRMDSPRSQYGMRTHLRPSPSTPDTATAAEYSYSDTASGPYGRDSLSHQRYEARDERHQIAVVALLRRRIEDQIMEPTNQKWTKISNITTPTPNDLTPESSKQIIDQALCETPQLGMEPPVLLLGLGGIDKIKNLRSRGLCNDWDSTQKKCTEQKYCPRKGGGEIKKLEIELWILKVKGNDVPAYTERFQELTLICTKFVANETKKVDKYTALDNKRKVDDSSRNNLMVTNSNPSRRQKECRQDLQYGDRREGKPYVDLCKNTGNTNVANTQKGNGATPKGKGCFECESTGDTSREICPTKE